MALYTLKRDFTFKICQLAKMAYCNDWLDRFTYSQVNEKYIFFAGQVYM